ncbi:acyl-CoA synthetase [Pseudidiomarina salinarum]|uniref:Acyl-CoA synthetase n=1 Tax=Pseudidiomarina salinarum TaxID=435908 RepID=A0A094JES0_9GAMM|nr:AMP-binding protein [Pseudidiomarina salinarum]KFZ31071.1 acyl-CoA synthetase [Pseudidiomarina salinarum]RUO71153.1 long-chain fatty acid--CoA ligase [Pseudidiomarina salinarum]
MTIANLLARNGRKYAEREAVIAGDQRYSWQQLAEHAARLAQLLRSEHGVEAGQRVGLVMPNSYGFIVGFFAIQQLGAIAVPINVRLATPELDYIIDDAGIRLVLTCQMTDAALKPLLNDDVSGYWLDSPASQLADQSELAAICARADEDPCTLLYTSGTTGRPKGVLFNHKAIAAVATMIAVEMKMAPESRLLHLMPFTHSAPLNLFLMAGTLVGATHVVAPTFTPDLLLNLTEQERITHFFGAPVAYLLTAQHPQVSERNLSSVRCWIYGGAPLSTQQTQLVQKAFRTDQFYCVYGLTEAGPSGTLLLPSEHADKAGSVGRRAALGCEVRLRDKNGKQPAVNEPGEIQLKGDSLMLEYWNKPDATAETFTEDGWLKTGDIGVRDKDGFYWIKDRMKDIIISGGVNIYPREIEDALTQHPAVAEAAVTGIPHEEWGETAKAWLVLRDELADPAAELKAFLQQHIADYKIPRAFEVLPELPRNANGKVLKHQLR